MKGVFIFCALSSLSLLSIAQCDKNMIYSFHVKEGKITIKLTKKDVVLRHDDTADDALKGDIKNFACEC